MVFLLLVMVIASCQPVEWAGPTSQGTIPTMTPSPTPELSTKKGIGATGTGEGCLGYTCAELQELGSWAFTWDEHIIKDCSGVEPVCMIRDLRVLERMLERGLEGCSDWLLTFNEPELWAQAFISPTLAAEAWREIERAFPDKLLIAPAVVRIHRPGCWWGEDSGESSCNWLDNWYSEYVRLYGSHPRIDALAGHCYGYFGLDLPSECRQMVNYLEGRLDMWGVTGGIWINEFGPNMYQSRDEMLSDLKATMLYFDGNYNVVRYAVWTLRAKNWASMNCMECDGASLTDYGRAYRDTRLHEAWIPFVVTSP